MLSRYRWATSIVYILQVVCLSSRIISVKVYISEHTLPWDIVDAPNGFSYSYIPQWLNEMPFFIFFIVPLFNIILANCVSGSDHPSEIIMYSKTIEYVLKH